MTTSTAIDFRLLEAIGTVFLSSIEKELVSMTYGVTRLLQQGMQTQHSIMNSITPTFEGAGLKTGTVDTLIERLATVIEELQQRNSAVARLEARVSGLEQSLVSRDHLTKTSEPPQSGATPTIAVSEVRLHAIEDSLNSVELLAGGLGQQDEGLLKVNRRLSDLETLLEALRHLPEQMGQQQQAIARMSERLNCLETQWLVDQEVGMRQIEPDRVF